MTASRRRAPRLTLRLGTLRLQGRLEIDAAPNSCAWLLERLPLDGHLLHARWSGEAGWVPLGVVPPLAAEHATTHARPGQILVYAGELSAAELLLPYGACAFASKAGRLAGNHVITLESDLDGLSRLGSELLWKGSQAFRMEHA